MENKVSCFVDDQICKNLDNKEMDKTIQLNTNNLSSIFSFLDQQTLTNTVPYVSKQWNKAFNDTIVYKKIDKLLFDLNSKDDIFVLFIKKVWAEISFCREWIAHEIAINRMYGNNRFLHKKKRKAEHLKGIFVNNAIFDRILCGEYALKNIFRNNNLFDDYEKMKEVNELLCVCKTLYQPSIEYIDSNTLHSKLKIYYDQICNLVLKFKILELRRVYSIVIYLIKQLISLYGEDKNEYFMYSDLYWIFCLEENDMTSCRLCTTHRGITIYLEKLSNVGDILVKNILTFKTLCQSCTECICEYFKCNFPKQNLRKPNLRITLDHFNNLVIKETDGSLLNDIQRVGFFRPPPFFEDEFIGVMNQIKSSENSLPITILRGKYNNILETLITKYQNIILKQNTQLKTKNTLIINLCMNDVNGFQEQCKEYYMQSKMQSDILTNRLEEFDSHEIEICSPDCLSDYDNSEYSEDSD